MLQLLEYIPKVKTNKHPSQTCKILYAMGKKQALELAKLVKLGIKNKLEPIKVPNVNWYNESLRNSLAVYFIQDQSLKF